MRFLCAFAPLRLKKSTGKNQITQSKIFPSQNLLNTRYTMKKSSLVFIILLLILFSCKNNIKTIEWISTHPIAQWQTSQLNAIYNTETNDSVIMIYPENKQQLIDGFGGCFNELGWEAMNVLSPEERENILKSLFDTITGCAFTICRMPIGANDYAVTWYSHNETKGDFDMNDFSIERDRERLIPYIRLKHITRE